MAYIAPKKIIKRKPGSKNQYFTNATQESIVKYQKEEDVTVKHKIYLKEILPAFDALVENLINVYGFKVMYEDKDDLKAECLEFLYMTVHKFNAEKGSKAFSYFNVVAKNWLTIKSKQNVKRVSQYISLDDSETISITDQEKIEKHNFVSSFDDVLSQEEITANLQRIIDELHARSKTPNEKAVVDAIRVVVEDLEELDFLSKRGLLVYLRNISNLNPKQLSVSMSSLKRSYLEIKAQILAEEEGTYSENPTVEMIAPEETL